MAKQKEKLKDLPQNELIEKMLKLQMKLAKEEQKKSHVTRKKEHKSGQEEKQEEKQRKLSDASQQTEQVARNLTEKWVKQHSRDPSKRSASQGDAEKKKEGKAKTEEKPAWDQAGWGGGDNVDAKW